MRTRTRTRTRSYSVLRTCAPACMCMLLTAMLAISPELAAQMRPEVSGPTAAVVADFAGTHTDLELRLINRAPPGGFRAAGAG